MLSQNNVIALPQAPKIKLNPKTRQQVNACKKAFAVKLLEQFQDVLGRVDDTLFSLADRADNNSNQTLYFEAMREIRKHRKAMESQFIKGWSVSFEVFWSTGESPFAKKDVKQESEFSLVESDDLEENLAIEGMITKGNACHKQALELLGQRVSYLLHGLPVSFDDNPFAPSMICHAYHGASKKLPIDIKVKLVLGKLFESHFMAELEGVYEHLNAQFATLGILPYLQEQKTKHVVKKSAEGQAAISVTEQHAVDQKIQVELFNSLQQLLSTRREDSGQASQVSGPQFDSNKVVSAVSNLQSSHVDLSPNSNSMLDLRAILLSEVQRMQSGGPEKQLAQTDSDTLDVLTMIFEFILEDKNLPDPMKVILGRLQIPLLKVSLMDKSFFGQKNHPARRLLNEMALAGLGWSADEGEGENTLYGVMTHIVQRVINEFDSQVSLFDDLLLDFKSFVEKEGKYAQVAEKRTNQVTKGKEQLELAKLQSLAEMETRLSDYLVPESIKALLEEGWKDVLVLLYLRQGVESEAYKAALQNLDQLLWSLQPVKETEERQKLLNMIPSITQKIQEGLIDISFESHKLSQLMKSIKEHHVDIIRGTVEIPVLDASQVIHPKKSRSSEVSDVEEIVMTDIQSTVEAQVEDDQYVAQARSLALGSWIEYLDESATAVRCKLSWKSEVTETFVFVNRAGSKVADMSLNGLTVLLRRESTQILQSVPLMDRAMSAMMSALKG